MPGDEVDLLVPPRLSWNSYSKLHVPIVMPKANLLPGVSEERTTPGIRCNAHTAIRAARREAIVRDALQLSLMVAIDLLFITWPDSHFPMLSRGGSLVLLQYVNALLAAAIWATRALPRWSARRISSTWCRSEQARFAPPRMARGRR